MIEEQIELERLLRAIQNEMQVGEIELASKSRERHIVWSRYVFANLAKSHLHWTDRHITSFFNLNRTMIFHIMKKHDDFINRDKEYTHSFNRVRQVMDSEPLVQEPKYMLTLEEMIRAKLFNKRMLVGIEA